MEVLAKLVDFPKCSVSRICIPAGKGSLSGIKLVCVADLAIIVGETAVYASGKLEGFTWSCALVAPTSKLLKFKLYVEIVFPSFNNFALFETHPKDVFTFWSF